MYRNFFLITATENNKTKNFKIENINKTQKSKFSSQL